MNLEEALMSRRALQGEFEKALQQKVKDLKFAYTRENLNEKQLAFIQRDETFCKAAENLFNVLNAQISYLKHENAQQQQFMADMQRDVTHYQELFINLCLEHNKLKQKVNTEHFSFQAR